MKGRYFLFVFSSSKRDSREDCCGACVCENENESNYLCFTPWNDGLFSSYISFHSFVRSCELNVCFLPSNRYDTMWISYLHDRFRIKHFLRAQFFLSFYSCIFIQISIYIFYAQQYCVCRFFDSFFSRFFTATSPLTLSSNCNLFFVRFLIVTYFRRPTCVQYSTIFI